jgi:mannose-6-phosphate isomerase-like protein (cupin superfamily)
MPELITGPSWVDKTGGRPEFCDTYMFPVRPRESHVQILRLRCAGGWAEPEETPASGHDEYLLVLRGLLRVEHGGGVLDVRAGEAVLIRAGERVQSSTPEPAGAEYIVVRLLGLPREAAHRGQK